MLAAAAMGCSTGTEPKPPRGPIGLVDWPEVIVPGEVCDLPKPIKLHEGRARVDAPPELDNGTPQVDSEHLGLVYGDLDGTGDDNAAALNVWCSNTGGTAAGQLKNTWVVFSYRQGELRTLATLVPQQKPDEVTNHVPYFDSLPGALQITPGRIVAKELWYGPTDGTCCPSVHKTTTWVERDGTLTALSTAERPTGTARPTKDTARPGTTEAG